MSKLTLASFSSPSGRARTSETLSRGAERLEYWMVTALKRKKVFIFIFIMHKSKLLQQQCNNNNDNSSSISSNKNSY